MKIKTRTLLLFLVSNFLIVANAAAQSLPDSTVTKINKIFAQWDKNNSPGCAVAIVRNDSVLFAKGYGMANLEYDIPTDPETIFHRASISKQFTAFSIVLLAKHGKLQMDDDIH